MKPADACLKWVEWSDEDGAYIGRCPDLFFGGCHGDNPVEVYAELCQIVLEAAADIERSGQPWPDVRIRPLVAA